MPKRFTDTTIWKNQKWFKKLDPIYKLAWKYITDLCDHAGVWKIDLGELTDDLGVEEFSLSIFIDQCNVDYDKKSGKKIIRKRIMVVKDDYLWITGFIKFQYEGKSKKIDGTSKVTISALEILRGFGLLDIAIKKEKFFELKTNDLLDIKPLQTPSNPFKPHTNPSEPSQGVKDKDKDKRIGTVFKEGGMGETTFLPTSLTGQMLGVFMESYPNYPSDADIDLPQCLELAYKIAKFKNWTKDSVVNGKLGEVVKEWKEIVVFSTADPWFSTRAISDFNKEFQRLIQKKNNPSQNGQRATSTIGKTFEPD